MKSEIEIPNETYYIAVGRRAGQVEGLRGDSHLRYVDDPAGWSYTAHRGMAHKFLDFEEAREALTRMKLTYGFKYLGGKVMRVDTKYVVYGEV